MTRAATGAEVLIQQWDRLTSRADRNAAYAANLLQVLQVAISSSSALRPATAGEDPDAPGRVRLTFRTELAWEHWVARLGGSDESVFAGSRELVNGEWRHRWMSSDAGVVCDYFERPI